jgi:hypothetical protein
MEMTLGIGLRGFTTAAGPLVVVAVRLFKEVPATANLEWCLNHPDYVHVGYRARDATYIDKYGDGRTFIRTYWLAIAGLYRQEPFWRSDYRQVTVSGVRCLRYHNIEYERCPESILADRLALEIRMSHAAYIHAFYPEYNFLDHSEAAVPSLLIPLINYGPVDGWHRYRYMYRRLYLWYGKNRIKYNLRPYTIRWMRTLNIKGYGCKAECEGSNLFHNR